SVERLLELRRQVGWARTFGLPLVLLSPDEAYDLFPMMSIAGVEGAAYLPTDGRIDPASLATALAAGARKRGVAIRTGVSVRGFERSPAPWGLDGIPRDFTHKLLAPDWERFGDMMEHATSRVPAIGRAEVITLINGPEAFTPDGEFILGEAPDIRGFFVAAGFCAHGIAGAGGGRRVMAEWLPGGRPPTRGP